MSSDKHKYDYDLIILGSGAGGGVAAHIAADQGKRVAIVEDTKMGGECPNFGCIPTKALLQAAEIYDQAKHSERFGIRGTTVGFSYAKIRQWKDLAVKRTGTSEGIKTYEADGIKVLRGHAHFLNPHQVSVGNYRYSARQFLIATGATDSIPPIQGLEEVGYITYRQAIDLTSPPKSLFVIGGGPIGCEFAELFSIFGTSVYIAEVASRLLSKEDFEVGELIKAVFEQRRGMAVLTSANIIKVAKEKGKKAVYYKQGYQVRCVHVDEILVASGKRANVDIGLENAGVDYTPKGIIVNHRMQSSAKHIYAAGDVAGPYMFTHMASYQSRIAAHNMFHDKKVIAKYHAVPRCVFTFPEVASVGMTEEEARHKGLAIKTAAVPVSIVGRANTSDEDIGFVKVIATKRDVLIGASIVSPRAGEMIHELALAVNLGLKAEDVAATIHAFPTWSEAIRSACAKLERS